jgi:hypothetical protein
MKLRCGRDHLQPPRPLLDATNTQHAADAVRRYYTPHPDGRFTGAYFERCAGGGDRPEVANTVTAEDVVAVSMLSVRIEGSSRYGRRWVTTQHRCRPVPWW